MRLKTQVTFDSCWRRLHDKYKDVSHLPQLLHQCLCVKRHLMCCLHAWLAPSPAHAATWPMSAMFRLLLKDNCMVATVSA